MAEFNGPTDWCKARDGTEIELGWTEDETLVRVRFYNKHVSAMVIMTAADLDDLRKLLNDRLE